MRAAAHLWINAAGRSDIRVACYGIARARATKPRVRARQTPHAKRLRRTVVRSAKFRAIPLRGERFAGRLCETDGPSEQRIQGFHRRTWAVRVLPHARADSEEIRARLNKRSRVPDIDAPDRDARRGHQF